MRAHRWLWVIFAAMCVALTSLIVPFGVGGKESARRAMQLSNLKQIGVMVELYCEAHDGRLPISQNIDELKAVIAQSPTSQHDLFVSLNRKDPKLVYFTPIRGLKLNDIAQPESTPLVYERSSWVDGKRAVVFTSGRVKRIDDAALLRLITESVEAPLVTSHRVGAQ